jgi:predicted Rossmann fold nucleotide-binding protein DprA/Smf involved in DNA uptake
MGFIFSRILLRQGEKDVRLAVVGSVKINDEQLRFAKSVIQGVLFFYLPELVISGGANGIDSLAINEAFLLNLQTKVHLPKNNRWEPEGYKERNTRIAEECTHLLCIRTQQSTTYGSGWAADLAERLGKTVWRVTI